MLFNRLLAWVTILGSFVILYFAVRLISKNSPPVIQAEARVMPPTQPNLISRRLDADTTSSAAEKTAGKPAQESTHGTKSEGPTNSAVRYIGGIGIVEPAGEAVSIGTQVPGVVTKVCVKPGEQVKQGDPLFILDSRSAESALAIAVANEKAAIAKLRELEGQIAPTRSKVAASQALLAQASADAANALQQYRRAQQLAKTSSISEEEVEARRLANELSSARVAEAEARLKESQANLALLAGESSAPTLDVQRAAIVQAEANVALAKTNVDLLTVRAPLDATVLQVKIRGGEFAPAAVLSNALMVLGVTDPLHVRVEIDESEIPRVHTGAVAYATVRGRSDEHVPLSFVRAEPFVVPKRSLSGGVSERVDTRVLQLIYSVSPKALNATVGQQVDVFIEEGAH